MKFISYLWIFIFQISLAQTPEPYKILFLGDSLTEGYGLDTKKAFPYLILDKLIKSEKAKKFSFSIIQGGWSGATSTAAKSKLSWFYKGKPKLMVLGIGANDGLRGIKTELTQKNIEEIIENSQMRGIKIVLLQMKLPRNYGKKFYTDFEKIYKKIAEKYKIPLVPFILEEIAGKKEFNLADGIHPNEKGHEHIAKKLYPYIQEQI